MGRIKEIRDAEVDPLSSDRYAARPRRQLSLNTKARTSRRVRPKAMNRLETLQQSKKSETRITAKYLERPAINQGRLRSRAAKSACITSSSKLLAAPPAALLFEASDRWWGF